MQSQVDQSRANLSRDEAQLALARANLARDEAQQKYAVEEVGRYSRMLQEGLVPAEKAEQVKTNADAVSAAVNADRAAIRSAEAAVEATRAAVKNAGVLLGYTSIRSPLDGRTGNLRVHQGNVVSANATELITINQVEPVYVVFSVPETQLSRILKAQTVKAVSRVRLRAAGDRFPDLHRQRRRHGDRDDPAQGHLPESAPEALAGGVRPRHPQSRHPVERSGGSGPGGAGQDGQFVFVVKPDGTVESRPVVTAERTEEDLVIEKGLRPDEVVVTEGQLRLAPGTRVRISGDAANVESGSGK